MITTSRALTLAMQLLVVSGCTVARAQEAKPPSSSPVAAGTESESPASPETMQVTSGAPAPLPTPQLYTRFFANPSELREELAVHEILPRLYFGTEVEAQAYTQKQDGQTENDQYFESATAALRWVPFYGLTGLLEESYDLQNSDGFTTDEATLTLGAVDAEPWYITVGRTNLPFGEFNSHFIEDPTTQFLGEIQGDEIAGGYESDYLEVTMAVREGNSGNNSYSWVGNVTLSPAQDLDMGVYYASDISRSFETQQLTDDARQMDPELPRQSAVNGAGGFLSLQKYNYTIDFEYIAALQDFDEGLLDNSAQKPWAWNFEATYRPTILWEVGARLEQSSGLPDSPELQYGVETSYSFGSHFVARIDYLRGTFADAGDRDLAELSLVMRW